MSSNMRLKKICVSCGQLFIAKTAVTKCCSDGCAKALYKKRLRDQKLEASQRANKDDVVTVAVSTATNTAENKEEKELVDIKALSALTSLSERTLFRLIKDPLFPKFKIGKKLLFKKEKVMIYLTNKYSNL
jgi:predicted DNA-binding transcriptional regulator AlpA